MMPIKMMAKVAEKFVVDNAPGILTGVGVIGAGASVVLTVKSTVSAQDKLRDASRKKAMMTPGPREAEDLTKAEIVKTVWVDYIPPAITLTTTVAAIVCANRMSTKRVAALAAAYSLSERNFSEYKAKVVEKFNPSKEQKIRDDIAQDHIDETPPRTSQIILTGAGEVLCHDLPTGRYFMSDPEKLRRVQNDINHQVNSEGYAALSDLYIRLRLEPTPYSDQIGWIMGSKMLDLDISATLTDEERPCLAINYSMEPLRGLRSEDPPF